MGLNVITHLGVFFLCRIKEGLLKLNIKTNDKIRFMINKIGCKKIFSF